MHAAHQKIVAILLAAGRGKRFDPAGQQDKLLQRLPDGQLVASQSAANLKLVFERVVAVVRPGQQRLMQVLREAGCETSVCVDADQGMASSLQHGLALAAEADAWLVALADMPFVQLETLRHMRTALLDGHTIVVPNYGGRRGNPVGFSQQTRPALQQLQGDAGARSLLSGSAVYHLEVDDPGILRDIDTPADLV